RLLREPFHVAMTSYGHRPSTAPRDHAAAAAITSMPEHGGTASRFGRNALGSHEVGAVSGFITMTKRRTSASPAHCLPRSEVPETIVATNRTLRLLFCTCSTDARVPDSVWENDATVAVPRERARGGSFRNDQSLGRV